jgi:glutaredoxin
MKSITLLPLKDCRRSKKLLGYLQENKIPFKRIDLESPEGKELMEKHQFLSSPGILVDDVSINPYDVLIPEQCRVNEENITEIFGIDET